MQIYYLKLNKKLKPNVMIQLLIVLDRLKMYMQKNKCIKFFTCEAT